MTHEPPPDASSRASATQGRTSGGLRRTWPILVAAAIGGYLVGAHQRTPSPPTPLASTAAPAPAAPPAVAAAPRPVPAPRHVAHHAWFKDAHPTRDARQVADWVVDSDDAAGRSFILVDKKDARVYVFEPSGWLVASAPALLGAAKGDDPVPGIGEKPLSQVRQDEKTTPAGRFIAEPGVNSHGEDIVWVSYDLAVSLHRVRPLVKAERRLQRLASPTPKDNRISFGCINLPPKFYEDVLRPTVLRTGAVVYVLPETRTPQQQFGAYDVDAHAATAQVAGLSHTGAVK